MTTMLKTGIRFRLLWFAYKMQETITTPQEEGQSKLISPNNNDQDKAFKIKAGAFLAGVTGVSMLFGFGTTLAAAKKKDPHFFDQGFSGAIENPKPTAVQAATATRHAGRSIKMEPGASLALRALGWGTLYSVAGCSVLFYTIWKLLDVGNLAEFREKMGQILPQIPKNNPPQGRTEFSGLNDLLQYVIDIDEQNKQKRRSLEEKGKSQN